jgi:hypothetical protein
MIFLYINPTNILLKKKSYYYGRERKNAKALINSSKNLKAINIRFKIEY